MAGKSKKITSQRATTTSTVTRIKATDDLKPAKSGPVKLGKKPATSNPLGRIATPFMATGRYFKGAWYELRQVRWPNRRATWSLTGAMLVFTTFFTVLILLLDALFKYIFQLILG